MLGKCGADGASLLPVAGELDPLIAAQAIGRRLAALGRADETIVARLAEVETRLARRAEAVAPALKRTPYFCSGCPHNTSTRVPEGSEAAGGIGCHTMAVWMDRSTVGYTQMGGEGAQWVGMAPFTTTPHIFQNLGDGTYFHSGILAIRQAVAAGVNITYKLLYNDAVAMTGGQKLDGTLTVPDLVAQLRAEGVGRIVVVSDEPERHDAGRLGVDVRHRDDLDAVQRALRDVPGVTAIVYEQTCASEKRRRRKRGTMADPARRAVINEAVCEGCGDCSAKSNCLSVVPVETAFGTKRAIEQSSCNKDFSCVGGFCPSFVTIEGGSLRKPAPTAAKASRGRRSAATEFARHRESHLQYPAHRHRRHRRGHDRRTARHGSTPRRARRRRARPDRARAEGRRGHDACAHRRRSRNGARHAHPRRRRRPDPGLRSGGRGRRRGAAARALRPHPRDRQRAPDRHRGVHPPLHALPLPGGRPLPRDRARGR